jgi:hypothetical protein
MANDTGSNYWFIPGGETPAPAPVTPPPAAEPVSPFEKYLIALENLQAPVELPASSYQQPAAPAFTPMAAPTAVQVNPASKFGPVTASGYAQPPVDSMSYYSAPEPVAQSIPNPNAPKRWFDFKTSTPDLSIPQSVAQPEQPSPNLSNPQGLNPAPFSPADVSPSAPSQQNNNLQDEFPGYAGLGFGDEIPGMPGTRIGDVIKDDAGNVWNWKEGRWDYAKITDTPLVGPRFETDPVNVSIPIEQQQPAKPTEEVGGGNTTTTTDTEGSKGTATSVIPAPGIVEPTRTPFTFTQRPVIQPPPTRVEAVPYQRKPIINPLIEPTTIPIPARRIAELLAPGYFKDINYDPDEILAAAMRSMGGRQARRSILSELQ